MNPGLGLLEHNRTYLSWLDAVLSRYPGLVMENCGSGGMRMEYSLLSRLSIQSGADQTDYLKMAAIACNCPTAVTPDQADIWSYPFPRGDEEETIFNMVNALLLRIHQSGHLPRLSPERLALVKEGISCHRGRFLSLSRKQAGALSDEPWYIHCGTGYSNGQSLQDISETIGWMLPPGGFFSRRCCRSNISPGSRRTDPPARPLRRW